MKNSLKAKIRHLSQFSDPFQKSQVVELHQKECWIKANHETMRINLCKFYFFPKHQLFWICMEISRLNKAQLAIWLFWRLLPSKSKQNFSEKVTENPVNRLWYVPGERNSPCISTCCQGKKPRLNLLFLQKTMVKVWTWSLVDLKLLQYIKLNKRVEINH